MTTRHQRGPRERRPGRPDRPELRLDVEPAWPARRRCWAAPTDRANLARQIAAPSATVAPTASTSTSSRSSRPTPTSSPRSSGPSGRELNKVARGYQLTFDTTGWIGNYPIEDATASGGADAVVVMGYDYRTGVVEPGRLGRADRRARPTTSATRSPPTSTASRPPRSSSACPYYGRAWSTATASRPREEHLGHQVRRLDDRRLRHGAPATPPTTAASGTRSKASPGPSTGARTARRPTAASTPWRQIYYDDATALGLKYDLVNRDEPARCRDLGARLRRDAARALRGAQGQVHHRQDPAGDLGVARSAARSSRPTATAGMDTVDRRASRSPGCIRFGWVVQPLDRRGRRHGDPLGAARPGKTVDLHVGRPGRAPAPVVRDGAYRITIWTADASNNRASVAKVVTVDRRPPRSSRCRSAPGFISPDGDGQTDRTTSATAADRADHRDRPGCSTATARPSARWAVATATTTGSWVWNGRDSGRRGRPRWPVHVAASRGSTGPATGPSARLTVRVDRTIRSVGLVARIVRAEGRRRRRASSFSAPPARRPSRSRSTRARRSSARSGRTRPLAAGTLRLDVERPDGGRGAASSPGTYRVVVDRDELDRAVDVHRGPSSSRRRSRRIRRRPTRLAAMPMTDASTPRPPTGAEPRPRPTAAAGPGVWVVLPTYNEAENLGPIAAAILAALPDATLLVVDDGSPDGTGQLADALAAADPRDPRPPPAGQAGSRAGLPRRLRRRPRRRRRRSSSRWTPTSATIRRRCPALVGPIAGDAADLVIGSRYTPGGGVVDWGLGRRIVSRGGSLFARIVLGLRPARPDRRLQGVAGGDARGRPVRRGPRRRLRLPDRDDLPGEPRRGAHPRGPDHLPRPARRPVEDEPADRRRGARRRRPAPRRGARAAGLTRRRPMTVTGPAAERSGRGRLGARRGRRPAGVRVVLDARPLQEPDRAPLDGGLPRRPARRLRRRRRSPASRSRSCSRPISTTRPPRFDAPRRRRAPPAAADPPPALRRR